jgi:hypothetical protein
MGPDDQRWQQWAMIWGQARVYRAGDQRIHPHAPAGALQRRGAGQADHAVLGRGVGRHAGHPDHSRQCRVVDDRATARRQQRRNLVLEAVEDAGEVLVQLRAPRRAVDLVHHPSGVDAAGVVERPVEPAELCHRRARQAGDVGFGGGIGGDEQRLTTLGADPHGDLPAEVGAAGADHHRGPFGRDPPRDRPPDPGASSGDHDDLGRQPSCHARSKRQRVAPNGSAVPRPKATAGVTWYRS